MEMTVFRIVQECLTNIHRHSSGKKANIRLLRSEEEIASKFRITARACPSRAMVDRPGERRELGWEFRACANE